MSSEVHAPSPPPTDLYAGVGEILRRPWQTLVPPWSWKAAVLSALLRSGTFFGSNLKSGPREALRAMLVEAVFAVVAAGLIGAISQRLRNANPAWATAAFVCLGLPGVMLVTQLLVHRVAHTPHVGPGLATSFCFAAVAAGFTWYAMRHGVLLGGEQSTSLREDIQHLPGITARFLLAIPRALLRLTRGQPTSP